ncbi:MAG: STAS domain-containing protein [Phycisphaerae bacterium]
MALGGDDEDGAALSAADFAAAMLRRDDGGIGAVGAVEVLCHDLYFRDVIAQLASIRHNDAARGIFRGGGDNIRAGRPGGLFDKKKRRKILSDRGFIAGSPHPEGAAAMSEAASRLRVTKLGTLSVVQFTDRKILDELSIQEINEELMSLVDKNDGARLLLSFSNVDHLASAALGMLISLNKRVKEKKGLLKLSDIKPQIYEIFKITRLNKMFDIHDTLEQARASL